MGFEVHEFLVGDVVDQAEQVREAAEHLLVELACQLLQLHEDEVEGAVDGVFEFCELRHQQRSETLHGGKACDFVPLVALERVPDVLVVVVGGALEAAGKKVEHALELALDDCPAADFL